MIVRICAYVAVVAFWVIPVFAEEAEGAALEKEMLSIAKGMKTLKENDANKYFEALNRCAEIKRKLIELDYYAQLTIVDLRMIVKTKAHDENLHVQTIEEETGEKIFWDNYMDKFDLGPPFMIVRDKTRKHKKYGRVPEPVDGKYWSVKDVSIVGTEAQVFDVVSWVVDNENFKWKGSILVNAESLPIQLLNTFDEKLKIEK